MSISEEKKQKKRRGRNPLRGLREGKPHFVFDVIDDTIFIPFFITSGNPLVCDCELRWYRQWIEEEWNEVEQVGRQ